MNSQTQHHRLSKKNLLISLLISEWQSWQQEQVQPHYSLAPLQQADSKFRPYALNMSALLNLPFGNLDEKGVLYNKPMAGIYPASYHPTSIAQYALAQWNAYLDTKKEGHRDAFLIQAYWLLEHEVPLNNGAGGWPIPFALRAYNAPPMWLSALTQGNAISVLVRAYQLTGEDTFLQAVHRAVRPFEVEIRDGGVAAFLSGRRVFFEEVATHPAAHILNGYILALFGLYDYVEHVGDMHIDALIKRSLATLHTLIDQFDIGYWSCYDLRFKVPSPLFYHALHVTLLEALARFSGCQHCKALAARWDKYQQSRACLLRYFVFSRLSRYRRALRRGASYVFSIGKTATSSNIS